MEGMATKQNQVAASSIAFTFLIGKERLQGSRNFLGVSKPYIMLIIYLGG